MVLVAAGGGLCRGGPFLMMIDGDHSDTANLLRPSLSWSVCLFGWVASSWKRAAVRDPLDSQVCLDWGNGGRGHDLDLSIPLSLV